MRIKTDGASDTAHAGGLFTSQCDRVQRIGTVAKKRSLLIPVPLQRVLARRASWFLYTKGRKQGLTLTHSPSTAVSVTE